MSEWTGVCCPSCGALPCHWTDPPTARPVDGLGEQGEVERIARELCEAKGYDPDYPIGETKVQWEAFKEWAALTLAGRNR